MPGTDRKEDSVPPGAGRFSATHWSVVLTAQGSDSTQARNALEKLCRAYWYPIYVFVRRQCHGPHDAQDLTREFFARLLDSKSLANVDQSKGRFRSFLLGALKHFLANEWDKARAQKRGGGRAMIPIDAASAETTYGFEIADNLTAEKIYERRWRRTCQSELAVFAANAEIVSLTDDPALDPVAGGALSVKQIFIRHR